MHKHELTGVVVDLSNAQPSLVAAFEKAGFQEVADEKSVNTLKPKNNNLKSKITKVAGKLINRD